MLCGCFVGLFIWFWCFSVFFFFSSRRRHTRWTGDWSSDVCSSDLVVHYVSSQGAIFLLQASWVIGHLLGYVIMGIALIRSRAIPLWAASLFIVGIPFQMAGYGTRLGILQLICFALIFIGSIPAALAMLRRSGEEAPLSAGEEAAARSTS